MSKCECEKCIHQDMCYDRVEFGEPHDYLENGQCKYFKDKYLFVELPCAFGEKLYIPVIGTDVVIDTKLIAIGVDEDGDVVYNPYEYSADTFGISGGEIGKTVFLTKEEAERKLREVGE